ncbi:MAG: bifunctional proline dehydrogenase/L-glutamate gamma-semialdehyde dehydrogenase PutA [Gammaproteobacteria bacterium]|nr:bifunctional proline dehydrogenase/L-glutamate gamma-semialdehyde dehydrogenase PutA [Gammaproteobacteria bacterium]
MLNSEFDIVSDKFRREIDNHYRSDETHCVEELLLAATIEPAMMASIQEQATVLVKNVRERRLKQSGLDAFMFQYDLSSEEGIALMCLAESLLRIPDKETVDKLIRDKLVGGDWQSHLGKSQSLFVNAATMALMLTGKIIQSPTYALREQQENTLTRTLKRLASKGGEPIVRQAISHAMKILGRQFVMGRTIGGALKRAKRKEEKGYRYSYDMLGEAAYTATDAKKYLAAYQKAIKAVGLANNGRGPISGPGISVKLSALHPRFVMAKRERLHEELLPILNDLVIQAKDANVGITIDAEEAHTLMINLEMIEAVITSGILGKWQGFGLAVQAYQKRAPYVLDWLIHLAREHEQPLMIRLVKGAYWDTEIKLSQVQGLSGYPVFTRKVTTDVNYIVCAKKLLDAADVIYPQFATHNALTLATIMALAKDKSVTNYEFQCLHGMGDSLYDQILENPNNNNIPCRIYAPVGTHEELLAYLVRRLLENGANTSFVNRIVDEKLPLEEMVVSPIDKINELAEKPHSKIPLPQDLFAPNRANSQGLDLSHPPEFLPVLQEVLKWSLVENTAIPTGYEYQSSSTVQERFSPIARSLRLGTVTLASKEMTITALERAYKAQALWREWTADERANALIKMGQLLQEHRAPLLSLLIFEGGKTIDDAVSELREAIDFCHYYACEAKNHFQHPQILKGPTGEDNRLSLHGRGIIACISPWNFPLAIFLGQVTASLASGNCVIAKPASQTVLIAAKAIALLHEAGIPRDVVQLLPGSGAIVGNLLVSDPRIKGVLFTGSTETARGINQKLAAREGAIVPFIAETGGQNAMIVDSSALPEQVTQDVITSAFRSAGQRCSALRVLFLQEDIADKIISMIIGAMAELKIGHPAALSTDIGPVIDFDAKSQLYAHAVKMKEKATLLYELPLTPECDNGSYFGPRIFEIPTLDILTEEVFGPILHVVRYKGSRLDDVLAQINRTGYGLTLGIHSRIDETIQYIISRLHVGNIYVNRNMIGAVVGVQPFGGEGLSGTGPKAGGPHFLPRLATERTISVNTTASGGNASLMSLTETE